MQLARAEACVQHLLLDRISPNPGRVPCHIHRCLELPDERARGRGPKPDKPRSAAKRCAPRQPPARRALRPGLSQGRGKQKPPRQPATRNRQTARSGHSCSPPPLGINTWGPSEKRAGPAHGVRNKAGQAAEPRALRLHRAHRANHFPERPTGASAGPTGPAASLRTCTTADRPTGIGAGGAQGGTGGAEPWADTPAPHETPSVPRTAAPKPRHPRGRCGLGATAPWPPCDLQRGGGHRPGGCPGPGRRIRRGSAFSTSESRRIAALKARHMRPHPPHLRPRNNNHRSPTGPSKESSVPPTSSAFHRWPRTRNPRPALSRTIRPSQPQTRRLRAHTRARNGPPPCAVSPSNRPRRSTEERVQRRHGAAVRIANN